MWVERLLLWSDDSRNNFREAVSFPEVSLLDVDRRADAVVSSLQAAGFKVTDVRYRTYPGVAPGIVLRQHPPAGHRVDPRTPLSLDVSRATS